MNRPRFPAVHPEVITRRLRELPVLGKPIAPRVARQCHLCRRRIGELGRLPCRGYPCCDSVHCELTKLGDITRLFPSPYGRAVDRSTLAIFTRLVELPDGRIVAQRQPVVDRAMALAQAYDHVIRWQEAFDHHAWYTHPDIYERGGVVLVPPRRIEDVLALRADGPPVPLDLTRSLPTEDAEIILRVYQHGATCLAPAF